MRIQSGMCHLLYHTASENREIARKQGAFFRVFSRDSLAEFFSAALILLLVCTSAARSQPAAQIPTHPRDLKYPKLDYSPPKSAAYRQVLSNGVVGYFVE